MKETAFQSINGQTYAVLLRIEVVLREAVRETLTAEFRRDWQKRIPGQMLSVVRESQREENRPQFGYARLGPLYYLTFGHLYSLLAQEPCKRLTKKLGGESFLKQLEAIFSARNAVCHSRPVSPTAMKLVEAVWSQIESALGTEMVASYLAQPDVGIWQSDGIISLRSVCLIARARAQKLSDSLGDLEQASAVMCQYWWATDELAGFRRNQVENAVELIRDYNALPTGVGSAGLRIGFIEGKSVNLAIDLAISELNSAKP